MSEVIINAQITSFGEIQNFYLGLKILLNAADNEVDISPILQDENKHESIYITLDKEKCKTVAAILNAYADLMQV